MEPGSDMLDRPCSVSGCSGRLRYRGGCFVEEGTVEFKVISNYYLVDEYRRQNKKPLDRAKFHITNRLKLKSID